MRHHRLLAMTALGLCAGGWTGPDTPLGPAMAATGDGANETGFSKVATTANATVAVFECAVRGDSRSDICAMAFDATGTRVDPKGAIISGPGTTNWDPSIACHATQCLITWSAINDGAYAVPYDVTMGPGAIQKLFDFPGTPDLALSVTPVPPAGYLALNTDYTSLYTQLVSPAGVPAGMQILLTSPRGVVRSTSIVSGTASALACWQVMIGASHVLECGLVDFAGVSASIPQTLGTLDPTRLGTEYASVWDGANFDVAYSDVTGSLRYATLTPAGAVLGGSVLVGSGSVVEAPSLSFDSTKGNVVVGWVEQSSSIWLNRIAPVSTGFIAATSTQVDGHFDIDAMTLTMTPNGSALITISASDQSLPLLDVAMVGALPDAGFLAAATSIDAPIQAGLQQDFSPRAVWTGSGWVTAWVVFGGGESQLWTREVNSLGVPLDTPRGVTAVATVHAWAPALAFAGTQAAAVWSNRAANQVQWAALDAHGLPLANAQRLAGTDVEASVGATQLGNRSFAAWSAVFGTGTWHVWNAELPADGGALAPANIFDLPGPARWVTVTASKTQVFTAAASLSGVFWAGGQGIHQHVTRVEAASDGTDFVVVWNEGDNSDTVRAVRIRADGGVLDPTPLTIAGIDFRNVEANGRPAVAFDGHAYRVAWEQNGDAGSDLYWRRLWPDGGLDAPAVLVGSPLVDEQVSLTAGDPGRILIQWRQFDPAQLTMRVREEVWAEIEDGNPCSSPLECLSGVCGACLRCGSCASDGGLGNDAGLPDALPDAGVVDAGLPDAGPHDAGATAADGGATEPRALGVACGCNASLGAPAALLVLGTALRRRRRR